MKALLALFFVSFNFSAASYCQNLFYPLQIDNRWEFNGKLSKAIKDTIMQNSRNYTMIVHSDTTLGQIRYERYDSSKVYRFNSYTLEEDVWFDFTKEPGDTINIIHRSNDTVTVILSDTLNEVILGKTRKIWRFITDNKKSIFRNRLDITDSLGIIRYLIPKKTDFAFDTLTISGAFIDSQLIRASYPFIYLPMQPGNWWEFDDGGLMTIERDTLMPNGERYALVFWRNNYYLKYLRQEKHFVFSYDTILRKDVIEMDMSAPAGQIWDLYFSEQPYSYYYFLFSGGIETDKVFSQSRRVYRYGGTSPHIADGTTSYTYADSLGIISAFFGLLYSDVIKAYVNGKSYTLTSVGSKEFEMPTEFELSQNYPNPFNPLTTIKFSIQHQSDVRISISDILGRNVTVLINEKMNSGNYEVQWNAENYSSGVYFYTLFVNSKPFAVKKLMLIK